MKTFIFANGDAPNLPILMDLVNPGDLLIAADAGVRHIRDIGAIPSAVIGDLDSIAETDRNWIDQNHVKTLRYPPVKDETDLELCLNHALMANPSEIIITACYGGRLDQMLGIVSLLLDPRLELIPTRLDDGVTEIMLVHKDLKLSGQVGDTVSLIPWGGDVSDVRTKGLEYPLAGEALFAHRSRGVSNRMLENSASIQCGSGHLLCVHIRQNA